MLFPLCYLLLAASLGMAAVRLFRGPSPGDRIIAIDLIAAIIAAAILVHAIDDGSPVFVDVVMVLGVVVFFGTVALARTLMRGLL